MLIFLIFHDISLSKRSCNEIFSVLIGPEISSLIVEFRSNFIHSTTQHLSNVKATIILTDNVLGSVSRVIELHRRIFKRFFSLRSSLVIEIFGVFIEFLCHCFRIIPAAALIHKKCIIGISSRLVELPWVIWTWIGFPQPFFDAVF